MVDLFTGADLSTDKPKGQLVKFVGGSTNPFPALKGKCSTAKMSLTKALTSLERTSTGFRDLTQETELLTKQRFARSFLEALEKFERKKDDLEGCFEALIEHVHGMTREDFEPHTDPTAVVESADSTCQERTTEAEAKLQNNIISFSK